ncbi:ice-binding family protein [Curtobacterium sp. MCLR17_036]|uniref:ice-binding family protein n=1 Tax=Curtobacterium sp. MCLR17_036 TaxID=2175620 RepID=UPI0024DF67D1|nr:ice-binding family protein [Curtobacterium sp. MCLR17_036]WIE63349.1 ice-binding family protein [Curtobacterium sp. MCLR17_036]
MTRRPRTLVLLATTIGLAALGVTGTGATAASAATVIDGPVGLGTAAPYGVLGASTVTNTGPTVVTGDVGVSPGTAITGFDGAPGGSASGTIHRGDAVADRAQDATTTAYDTAASLTPTTTGLTELNGRSLAPGVYRGDFLQLAGGGALTLAGDADSVWVFQAGSTLTIGDASRITITGGASSCNVFWQVGSSATIGSAAQFQGTVLARQSITATTGATVAGRLLARAGAVTLDTNTITAPTGCPADGTITETTAPEITSGAPSSGTVGTEYSFPVTATGSPAPTYTATGLPDGLTIDSTTGVVSGTPTTAGTSTVTVTADNGTAPADTATYVVTIRPAATASAVPSVAPSATPTTTPGATTPAGGPSATAVPVVGGGTGELAYTGSGSVLPGSLAAAALVLTGAAVLTARTRRRRDQTR